MIIKTNHTVTMNITQIIDSNIVHPTQTFFFPYFFVSTPKWIEVDHYGLNWNELDQTGQ